MRKFITLIAILLIILGFLVSRVSATQGDYNCNSNNEENCPIPTQICENGEHTGNPHCNPSPTVTPEPTEEVTPTVEPSPEATPSPTTTQPYTPPSDHGDGLSDGKSDGRSSCPECTKAPEPITFANTGSDPLNTVFNIVGIVGGVMFFAGISYFIYKLWE